MNVSKESANRIFKKIQIDADTECWNWTGARTSNGYGSVRVDTIGYRTHRFIYEWLVGELPKGKGKDIPVLDHICNNRLCCNPSHLQLVSDKENILRGNGVTARKSRQTHCKNGHLLPQSIRGHRRCMICHRAWNRKNYSKNPQFFLSKVRERRLRNKKLI